MCSLRNGVTVFPINVDDILVTLSSERTRSSSSGRILSQFLSLSTVVSRSPSTESWGDCVVEDSTPFFSRWVAREST